MRAMSIPKATLGRIPQYLNYLQELPLDQVPYISATTIARELHFGEVQVRKDLAAVSGAGRPRLGYETAVLIQQLENCLGYNQLTAAVLVGAGRLGRALLQYDGFRHFGVEIAAAFDCNDKVITIDSTIHILPMHRFDAFCTEHNVQLGIITVGEGSAQDVCDRMVQSGIKAIWNFAPCQLQVPQDVLLHNENLALSLAHLRNQLAHTADTDKDRKQNKHFGRSQQ